MRIGIDASCLPPVPAGASRYIAGLIHGLATTDSRNEYFVFLKAQDRDLVADLPPNMQPVFLPNFSRPLRIAYQHLIAAAHARRLRLDLWHGTHYGVPQFARCLRLVCTFHDLSLIEFAEYFSATKRFYFRRVFADATRRAAAIVCVSEATREALQQHFPVDGRAVTVHSGVAPVFFRRVAAEQITRVRRLWNLDQPYVLFLGTLEPHKNVTLVLQAFALLRQTCREGLQLVIAGQRGRGWAEARSLIKKLKLEAAVRVPGYVSEDVLPAIYQGARLLVLPSFIEGFGFTALEAMASGIPVLAARAATGQGGAPAELINHPLMLCEQDPQRWAARIKWLVNDEALRRELSAYGTERARQFSWSTAAQRMVELYESVGRDSQRRLMLPVTAVGSAPRITTQGKHGKRERVDAEDAGSHVNAAVTRTIIYADLFDYPLRLQEVHDGLLGCAASLKEVSAALKHLQQHGVVGHTVGFWHLRGREAVVVERHCRRKHTRKLWQRHINLLRVVCTFPFVKGVALSGAASFENCTLSDDIDLFVIADARRLWLTYSALVLMLKMLGKRQLLCLNYLISHKHLKIRDRDLFVAHQIAFLRPIRGREIFGRFFCANRWVHRYLPQTAAQRPASPPGFPIVAERKSIVLRTLECALGARSWDFLERAIYHLYSRRLHRRARDLGPEDVEITSSRIKLFTNNHRFTIRTMFEKRFNEAWASYCKTRENAAIAETMAPCLPVQERHEIP